jgi:hypothetical protein
MTHLREYRHHNSMTSIQPDGQLEMDAGPAGTCCPESQERLVNE